MKIIELIIQTAQLAETEVFYSTVLNLETVDTTDTSITFSVGTSRLTFEQTKSVKNPKYHFAFNIPVNKVAEAARWITGKATVLKTEGDSYIARFESWDAQAIYFYDNNKNIVEFIARADLKNYAANAFSAESILSINEVGIVTDEPLQLGDELTSSTNINFFSKGPKREDFLALGDDHGLFIVARTNRPWYPTTDRAEKQKTKVKIGTDTNSIQLEFN